MSSGTPQNNPTTSSNKPSPGSPPIVRASHRFREINGKRYLIANDTLAHTNFRELRTDEEKNAFFLKHFEKVQDIAEDEKGWRGELPRKAGE